MAPEPIFDRYRELQTYAGWSEEDASRVKALGPLLSPCFAALIDDFYEEIKRHPAALKVIVGGEEQIARLKKTLHAWLVELFSGVYDDDYVARRWRVGWRHVEVGLDQIYASMALARLRQGLMRSIIERWTGTADQRAGALRSLNLLLDLDLTIIVDAYQTELMRRFQHAERLATIGQVAAGVAHELRNPLNVIRTSVYFLLNARKSDPAKFEDHLRRIERQVGLSNDVITALTEFAKLPVPDLKPVAVRPCFEASLESCTIPGSIEVAIHYPANSPPVMADAAQLRIVLANLIRNACDAMPQGGKLTLRADVVGLQVELSVADTGVGIAPDVLPRIMEPLYSTKARGIGLGLALARGIVEKHKGQLRVVSEPGRGSTFSVTLPAAGS
jgi:signal transduction histidine kinase